jgi:hypothetical protein
LQHRTESSLRSWQVSRIMEKKGLGGAKNISCLRLSKSVARIRLVKFEKTEHVLVICKM